MKCPVQRLPREWRPARSIGVNVFSLLRAALQFMVDEVVNDHVADGWAVDVEPADDEQPVTTTAEIRHALVELMRSADFNIFDLEDFPAGLELEVYDAAGGPVPRFRRR